MLMVESTTFCCLVKTDGTGLKVRITTAYGEKKRHTLRNMNDSRGTLQPSKTRVVNFAEGEGRH